MTNSEAEKIIERLKNGCGQHRFDESGVWKEYYRFLLKCNYTAMDEAVSEALEQDSRFAPAISALSKLYREAKNTRRTDVIKNEKYCPVCDDKGFGFVTKKEAMGNYVYVLYCPFCEKGKSFAYDGRECKDKSLYHVEPLTKYYSEVEIKEMRQANLERWEKREEREAIAMEGVIEKIGVRI